ncbi:MAG: class II aldolase/adducin family protein, partial [Gammaproteobacteria bacterium]
MAVNRQRRTVLKAALYSATTGGCSLLTKAYAQGEGTEIAEQLEVRRLVAANRILANEGVVDAFGHVSVRDPRDPDRYVMAWARSPALIEYADLMEFEQDGTPLDARGRRPYGERMIHGAIYETRSDVNAVVHHHAYSVIPYSVTSAELVPLTHTASVIGAHIPVWDSAERFGDTDTLVR